MICPYNHIEKAIRESSKVPQTTPIVYDKTMMNCGSISTVHTQTSLQTSSSIKRETDTSCTGQMNWILELKGMLFLLLDEFHGNTNCPDKDFKTPFCEGCGRLFTMKFSSGNVSLRRLK